MDINPTKWIRSGLALAFSAMLMACGSKTDEAGIADAPHAASIGSDESVETDHVDHMDTLPIEYRLAFMSGHVQAGLALYRAGEPGMAAPHLLHPVSETHHAERKGLDALGFTPAIFETVSEALEQNRPASDIEPQLRAAEANLKHMADTAGGDSAGIIRFLMATIDEEYGIALTDGKVSDPGEYQDAFGFAVVARDRAESLAEPHRSATVRELDELIALWPKAPVPPDNPTSVARIMAKTSAVTRVLPD